MHDIERALNSPAPENVMLLAPSILAADFSNLSKGLKAIMAQKIYWAHLDVMDGHFVPNITFGPGQVKWLRKVSPKLFLDTHLMIEEPLKFAPEFAKAGSDMITFHAETVQSVPRAVSFIRRLGVHVGVTIRPRTSLKIIEDVLDKVDLVLVMTVEPGFGGQDMIPSTLTKVRQLASRRAKDGLKFLIQVDGGIHKDTIGIAAAAGANVFVAGTAVFGGGDVKANAELLMKAAMG